MLKFKVQVLQKIWLFGSVVLGSNASYVIEYSVLEILSPGQFFFAPVILICTYNFDEKIKSRDSMLY